MSDDAEVRVKQVDPAYLTDLVRCVLDKPRLKLKEWQCQPIQGGFELSNAILRCWGQAEDGELSLPWSLVVKIIRSDEKNSDGNGIWYWKREAQAYQSGFFQRMPKYLAAPCCYAIAEQPDGSMWLWMEDVRDDFGGKWSLEHHGTVAHQLGQFNAQYLNGTPLPDEKWITHNWLRKYVEHAAPVIEFMRNNPTHPIIDTAYGQSLHLILGLWEVRKMLLDSLDSAPQVFCHQDAFSRNLFTRQGQLVAIDWGYAGIAPLGAELVPLVAVSAGMGNTSANKIFELDRICFDGYLRGLQDCGVNIPRTTIRRNFVLTILLRYVIGGNIGEVILTLLDEKMRERLVKAFDGSIDELTKTDETGKYYMAIFIETLKIMGIRPLAKTISSSISTALYLKKTHGWKIPRIF
jgi:hypothetical protein